MRHLFSAIIPVVLFMSLLSCRDSAALKRKVSGKAGDVVVVIPKETWEGQAGEAIRNVLQQPQPGLPREEPVFHIINVPPAAFQDLFKSNRNVVNVRISPTIDSAKVEFRKDVWVRPQSVVNILAKSQTEFIDLFNKNADRIADYLLKAERERLQTIYAEFPGRSVVNLLKRKFNIEMDIPKGFTVAKTADEFVWVRHDAPEVTQSIVIYASSHVSDSTFTRDFMLARRDSVLKNVSGPLKDSYIVTESTMTPIFRVFEFKKNRAAEMRGLWRAQDGFTAGPYMSLSVMDQSADRIVTVDGFVYAPDKDKRNYLRRVEAMIYSLRFPPVDDRLRAESTNRK